MLRLLSYFLLLCALGGCATKTKEATLSPVPDKPQEKAVSKSEKSKDRLLTYEEDAERQYVVVHEKSANGNNEPEELIELLEAKGTTHAKETAAARLRPEAMRDAANLVALQSACPMSTRGLCRKRRNTLLCWTQPLTFHRL